MFNLFCHDSDSLHSEINIGSLPLETFGFPWYSCRWLSPLVAALKWYMLTVQRMAASINEAIVLGAICMPTALIYFVRIVLARISPVRRS